MLNTPQTQISIPQHILDSARLTPTQLKQELALTLYSQQRLSIGKARELANMPLQEFRQLLHVRKIPVHYTENDLNDDLEAVKAFS